MGDKPPMVPIGMKKLVALFRGEPFSIKILDYNIDLCLAVIGLEFFNTTVPPHYPEVETHMDHISLAYVIDIGNLLQMDREVWKDTEGIMHTGVLTDHMVSYLSEGLAKGACIHRRYFKKAEAMLEIVCAHLTMAPRTHQQMCEYYDSSGFLKTEKFTEYRGLMVTPEQRLKFLDFICLEKTKYLYEHFGREAAQWMAHIRRELPKAGIPSEKQKLKQQSVDADMAKLKAEAKMLMQSLHMKSTKKNDS